MSLDVVVVVVVQTRLLNLVDSIIDFKIEILFCFSPFFIELGEGKMNSKKVFKLGSSNHGNNPLVIALLNEILLF